MAWNQTARPLLERLPRRYNKKGVAHWQSERDKARRRARTADDYGTISRAIARANLCELAVLTIQDNIRHGWID